MVSIRKRKTSILIIFLLTALVIIFAGCTPAPDPVAEEEAGGATVTRVSQLPPVDGNSDGYPAPSFSVGEANVYIAHNGDILQLHVTVEGNGWISAGFNERGRGMDGASLVLGALENGTPLVRNDLGRGWAHSAAPIQGVTESIVVAQGGFITLEFSYPLDFPEGSGWRG